jgi:acetyl esterase
MLAGPPVGLGAVEDLTVAGAEGPLEARLYAPTPTERPGGLLLYLHGGGWVSGDLDTHEGPCRLLAHHAGVPILAVHYRRAPEHPFPAAVDDAFAALRWTRDHAGALGADPSGIAIGGDSAGGNLAAVASRVARDAGEPAPAMQLLIYPVTDLSEKHRSYRLFREGFYLTEGDMDWYRDHYLSDEETLRDPRVSPLLVEDLSGLPPAYVVTAGFDPLRDEAEAYARRLEEAGVPVAVRRHTGLIHGFANLSAVLPAARAAMLEAAGALRMGLAASRARAAAMR